MWMKRSFSFQLLKNFLWSTFLPFMLVTSFIAHFYSKEYNKDIQTLLNSAIDSMSSNLNTYLSELEQVTLQPYYNDSLYDYLQKKAKGIPYPILDEIPLRNNVDSNFKFVRFSRPDIDGIFIFAEDQCLYYTTKNFDHTVLADDICYSKETWYQNAISANGRCLLMAPHIPDYLDPIQNPVISLIRSIVTLKQREPLYVIKIDINTSIFDRIFKDFSFHVHSRIIITDENQNIIYTNAPLSEEDGISLKSGLKNNTNITLSDGTYNVYKYPLKRYPWNITVILSTQELQSRTNIIYLTALILYLVGMVTSMLSHMAISKKLVTSIHHMKDVFLSIQNKDFSNKYCYVSHTELDDLGDSLNQTASFLEHTIQQEYIMTLKQKESEFRALQNQIQPHFLFNVLNNLIALNQLGNRETLENSLFELSGMLRYILKAPSLIPLSMELKCIQDYCALQKLRFNDRLSYHIQVPQHLEHLMIPKLLLQPIAENSILHGIEPCDRSCCIHISAWETEDFIAISIEDNGVGYDADIQTKNSIGLSNIRERLKSFSPDGCMKIESTVGKGTKTLIFLCKKDMEDANENTDCR